VYIRERQKREKREKREEREEREKRERERERDHHDAVLRQNFLEHLDGLLLPCVANFVRFIFDIAPNAHQFAG
jgi:hypothetical protein